MRSRQFQFEWDEIKAATNIRKHDILFDLARTVFNDPLLLTIADLAHGEAEERWLSIGQARNDAVLSVAYLWTEIDASMTKIRIISARRATQTEIRQYKEGL